MNWLRVLILLCTLVEAGWMAFDGTRALMVGDFVTRTAGPYAGQLGPWRHLVEGLGVNPRGTPMNVFFAVYGWTWLLLGLAFACGAGWARRAMLIAAAGTLWFLPFGTFLSIVQIVSLMGLRD